MWFNKPKIVLANDASSATYKKYIYQEYKLNVMDGENRIWRHNDLQLVERVLKIVPPIFHGNNNLKYIIRTDDIREPGKEGSAGAYIRDTQSVHIYDQLAKDYAVLEDGSNYSGYFQYVFFHELVHAFLEYKPKKFLGISWHPRDPLVEIRNTFVEQCYIEMFFKEEEYGYDGHKLIAKPEMLDMLRKSKILSNENLEKNKNMRFVIEEIVNSLCAYVFSSTCLKISHPKRYELIKNLLFNGKEYPSQIIRWDTAKYGGWLCPNY